jgi:lactate dehydrogenase-like 2-hydroxyacid dehydrogenase
VFADEPGVPEDLVRHPRVVTLPHLGSATVETRKAMAQLAVRNVRAVLAGEGAVSSVF